MVGMHHETDIHLHDAYQTKSSELCETDQSVLEEKRMK